jgi:hypothetical protein
MLFDLNTRSARAATTAGATLPVRLVVCPPAARRPSAVMRMAHWLQRQWAAEASLSTSATGPLTVPQDLSACSPAPSRGMGKLAQVQRDFVRELADIRTAEAGALQGAVLSARTLRELWHLRSKLFGIVAVHFSQAEAQERLSRLNRHFPTRSPRSGLAPFDLLSPEPR